MPFPSGRSVRTDRERGRANTRRIPETIPTEDPSLSLSLSLHLADDDFIKITGPRSFYPPISKRLSVECLLLLWSPSGRKIIRDGSRDTQGKKKKRGAEGGGTEGQETRHRAEDFFTGR